MKVLFGVKTDWNDAIAKTLAASDFDVSVAHLDSADLSLYDAVVPLQMEHYEELRRAKRQTGNFLMPSERLVALCDDKRDFSRFLVAQGFGDHVPQPRFQGGPFPYVWKPRHGSWGRGCHVVRDENDEGRIGSSGDGFAQECIEGRDEYAIHVLSKAGAVRYMSLVKYEMRGATDIKGAECSPLRSENVDRPPVFSSMIAEIIARLGYDGISCFDIKMRNGLPVILEMNPRFGGSLCSLVDRFLLEYISAVR